MEIIIYLLITIIILFLLYKIISVGEEMEGFKCGWCSGASSWEACGSKDEAGGWCSESKKNCVGQCNGRWFGDDTDSDNTNNTDDSSNSDNTNDTDDTDDTDDSNNTDDSPVAGGGEKEGHVPETINRDERMENDCKSGLESRQAWCEQNPDACQPSGFFRPDGSQIFW